MQNIGYVGVLVAVLSNSVVEGRAVKRHRFGVPALRFEGACGGEGWNGIRRLGRCGRCDQNGAPKQRDDSSPERHGLGISYRRYPVREAYFETGSGRLSLLPASVATRDLQQPLDGLKVPRALKSSVASELLT